MPKSLVRAYRGVFDLAIVRGLRDRSRHEMLMHDPRVAAEHRAAHLRALDANGTGCPYCD